LIPWNEFVQEYGPTVYRVALRIVGQPADAEDVVQDVFLEVHRLWKSREVVSWNGVLRKLATRRAIDCLRQRSDDSHLSESAAERPEQNPELVASIHELEEYIRKSIARLPPQQAEVISLHFLEGLSHSEIAEALKIGNDAVASALHKARARLSDDLRRYFAKQEI
jgi:RNA polymerase sigma-70 factor (ECF subfamily)